MQGVFRGKVQFAFCVYRLECLGLQITENPSVMYTKDICLHTKKSLVGSFRLFEWLSHVLKDPSDLFILPILEFQHFPEISHKLAAAAPGITSSPSSA